MTLHVDEDRIPDADILIRKVIKDLETGAEYPYKDSKNAALILKRIAKIDRCPVASVLETTWVQGCSIDEYKQIVQLTKDL